MPEKKPVRRPVALPRLHKSIERFCAEHELGVDQPIGQLLDAVRDAWFAEAKP